MMRKLLTLLFLVFLTIPTIAQDLVPDQPTGMVNDYANMLSQSEERQLENKLRAYRDTTTNAFVIATIESLQGYPIEDVALKIHNEWNIQYEDRGNGVLILISEQDRAMRIEVGYGLEGAIPDIIAGRIINEILTPSFRANDYYGGLDQSINVLIDLAAGEFEGFPEQTSSGDGFPIDVLIIFIIIIFILITRGKGGRRHSIGSGGIIFYGGGFGGGNSGGGGSFGGGGGFGGFGGGGGFSSGGGGASGGW
jgi:uncharacterized protein